MDRLESMSVLIAVVDAGSFSGAGRRLRMPVPTVSRKVAELESYLGARLLVRSTRRLVLTETGQTYIVECRRILEELLEAERRAAGEYRVPRGELVLTAPVVLGRTHVLPVLAEFLREYPEVSGRLMLTDRSLDLIGDHVDLAVRVGELPDSRLTALRVGTVRSVVCAAPSYLKRYGTPKTPAELATHQCVTFAALPGSRTWTFVVDGRPHPVTVRSRLVVTTAEAAIDAAIDGIGLTQLLSYQIATAIKARKLAPVLVSFEPEPLPVSMVYGGGPLLALKVRAFVDFAAPKLRKALAPS
ncbi:MAG: LysR family transcriptional regulator, partial [Gammaproteobacteria bacterium]|nr:LysR family transcriptional regulator [Gammaproteobacteria bacterium]